MRLTKLMGIAVVLVALAVALNALAFRTGAVTNTTTFTVDTTGNSAIAIEAATPAGSGYNATFSNIASFVITDNMQPGSTYKFKNVFKVTNKAINAVTPVVVTATTSLPLPAGVTVSVFETGTANVLNESLTTTGSSMAVDLEITLANTVTTGGKTFDIVINGTQDAP